MANIGDKPFEVGDVVVIARLHKGKLTDVPRIITKIEWVGGGRCQSGWLVDAKSSDPKYAGFYDLKNYDSGWFELV